MCSNQYESNGQFLYQADLHRHHISIPDDNNIPRQGGGLYAVGLYFRLYHNQSDIIDDLPFDLSLCIDGSIRYLTSISVSVTLETENPAEDHLNGKLIDGNLGATSLALMGMIEVCVAQFNETEDNLCIIHWDMFKQWIHGVIKMRNHKLSNDNHLLVEGLAAKNLDKPWESSTYYDSETYLALARLSKFKNYLLSYLPKEDPLWNTINDIIVGADKYYYTFPHFEHDHHWVEQAWFDRWVTLNRDDNVAQNAFMDHYIVSVLMTDKWAQHTIYLNEGSIEHSKKKLHCEALEGVLDMLHAAEFTSPWLNESKYGKPVDENDEETPHDELYFWKMDLWQFVKDKYHNIKHYQYFKHKVDFYYESRYDGAFKSSIHSHDPPENIRVDYTQHCICALMKLQAFIYSDRSDQYDYIFELSLMCLI